LLSRGSVFSLLLLLPPTARGAEWRSLLYPADWQPPAATKNFLTDQILQDFSYAGYHRGEAPVPSPTGPVFNVTDAAYGADPSGSADSTSAIQAAINAAQTNGSGVVYLPAGTYKVAPPTGKDYALTISHSSIILRGAGAGQTKILNSTSNMRGKAIVLVQAGTPLDWRVPSATGTPLTADLTGPATVIPVADPAKFPAGDWVTVRCDATDAWATEQLENDWVGQGATLGGLAYLRQVKAVDTGAGTITIDIPTRYALKVRDNARVEPITTPLTEVGLESFSIGNVQSAATTGWGENDYNDTSAGAYECHSSYAIRVTGAADSWVRNVSTFQAPGNTTTAHILSNGIRLTFCRTMTLQNCAFQRPQYGGGGGNGYLYRLDNSGDNLVQDCTATFARHGFIFSEMATSGNVLYRCIDSQTARYTGSTGSVVAGGKGSEHHMHFSHSNLIDSCTANSSFFLAVYRPFGTDPKHDLTAAHSVFWNTIGNGDPSWTGAEGSYAVATQQSRYGYVIGTSGTRSQVLTGLYFHSVDSTPKTTPVDYVEGVGEGTSLQPPSLYEDQVLRRLGQSVFRVSTGADQSLYPPTTQTTLSATVTNGPPASQVAGAASFVWTVISAPASATFSSTTVASPTVTLGGPGTYEFQVRGTWNGTDSTDRIVVTLSSTPLETHFSYLLATKDASIRGGDFADTNFGSESTIQLKKSDQANLQREALLQFAPPAMSAASVLHADLVLTPTNSPGTYSGEVLAVPNTNWVESAVTWNNQPAATDTVGSWQSQDNSTVTVDVTSAVLAALNANASSIAFKLRLISQTNPDAVVAFRSKEGSSSAGPTLRVTLTGAAPTPTPPPKSSLSLRITTRTAALQGKKRAIIRGSVSSSAGVQSITVTDKNRHATAKVSGGGSTWQSTVPMKPGKNVITARAVDVTGETAETSRKIQAK